VERSPSPILRPAKALILPRLYPIIDAGLLASAHVDLEAFARGLYAAGIRFLQYRDKDSTDEAVIERAGVLRSIFSSTECTLILNDRVHLVEATGFDGVHVGQDDLTPQQAREVIGGERILGLSTHNARQVAAADREPVDYIAIGPIFGTKSKADPDPVVGREGIAHARATTQKPLVAIGGITPANSQMLLRAGADSLAIISALIPVPGEAPGKRTEDFLLRIR
jgi:thiamine-phosphate pyrophosphorylase